MPGGISAPSCLAELPRTPAGSRQLPSDPGWSPSGLRVFLWLCLCSSHLPRWVPLGSCGWQVLVGAAASCTQRGRGAAPALPGVPRPELISSSHNSANCRLMDTSTCNTCQATGGHCGRLPAAMVSSRHAGGRPAGGGGFHSPSPLPGLPPLLRFLQGESPWQAAAPPPPLNPHHYPGSCRQLCSLRLVEMRSGSIDRQRAGQPQWCGGTSPRVQPKMAGQVH